LLFKKLTILSLCACYYTAAIAQVSGSIDVGSIHDYDTVEARLTYFIDASRRYSIRDVEDAQFSPSSGKSPFDQTQLDANYFIRMAVTNTGSYTDTFYFYAGKAQHFSMYEYDTLTHQKKLLDNHIAIFSPALFNTVPCAYFVVRKGESKVFYIQAKVNFFNWYLFDPVILVPSELSDFSFYHILHPSRVYIYITVFLLGIMFSMFAYTFAIFVRESTWEYFYYASAILVFMLYFGLRLLNVFYFSELYFSLYDLRYQALQLMGLMLILQFIIYFLRLKIQKPRLYRQVKGLIYLQIFFLLVNLPLTYTNRYNYAANIAFDVMRIGALLFSAYVAVILILKEKKKEARYLGIGSLLSIFMACIALYVDRWGNYDELLLRYSGLSVLIFMAGVVFQMIIFLEALGYRRRMLEAQRIRAFEQLQLENDRKELDKYRAIIDARDNERNRISQEIHDDIGSGLTSIRLLSEIAKVKMTPQESKELEKISATSNVLMEKMNEIIWTLNSRNDTLPNLIAYLRHQVVEFFEPLPVRLQLTVPDRIPEQTISGKARRNITLSVKEALHNIVKHSGAAEVSITFTMGEFFTISIKDNGIGFNPDDTRILSNGIRNMKERLNIIGGSCQIINGEGTLIILSIPLV